MFSKPKPDDTAAAAAATAASAGIAGPTAARARQRPRRPPRRRPKPAPSVLSSDLTILGNVRSSGDIQIEGIVEGDIRAQMLIVGESATVKGEVIADEVVVHGRVVGRLRGLKVRLSLIGALRGRHRPQDDRHRERRALRGLGAAPGRPARQRQEGRAGPPRRSGDQRRRIGQPAGPAAQAGPSPPVRTPARSPAGRDARWRGRAPEGPGPARGTAAASQRRGSPRRSRPSAASAAGSQ